MKVKDYYKQKTYLAAVDKKDRITGRIDRWKAHEEGILHRGFTAILMIGDTYFLQHRKHPAFDGYWDLTFSSHQIYMNDILQTDEEAIKTAFTREWKSEGATQKPEYLGNVYYKAKDPGSIYTEHEVDRIYLVHLTDPIEPDFQYAYGYETVEFNKISTYRLAPWVMEILAMVSARRIAKKG